MSEHRRRIAPFPAGVGRDGVLDGWLERIALGQLIRPPSIVVRRSPYETVGGFDARLGRYGQDWAM